MHSTPSESLALDTCAKEPIHLPGSIQPHGALFVLTDLEWVISHASANAGSLLGLPDTFRLIGRPLEACLGDANVTKLRESSIRFDREIRIPVHALCDLGGKPFDASLHRHDGRTILEIEPALIGDHVNAGVLEQMQLALDMLNGGLEAPRLHDIAARRVKDLTGLDRVMIYRFDEAWNGEVIAEAKRADLASFLGLQYPASDIPAQARRLFATNLSRFIPDARYVPVPVLPQADHSARSPLDLSFAHLRSSSPVHLEYLKNMGVRASLTLSLMVEGRLWGMIACHHSSPANLSQLRRKMAGIIAQTLSTNIGQSARRAIAAENLRLTQLRERMLSAIGDERKWLYPGLTKRFDEDIRSTLGVATIVNWSDGVGTVLGEAMSAAALQNLLGFLRRQLDSMPVVATSRLGQDLEGESKFGGMLAARIGGNGESGVAVLRLAREREVRWAGDPRKAVTTTEKGARVSPRQSFTAWRELVKGQAIPWSAATHRFVQDLAGLHERLDALREQDRLRKQVEAQRDNLEALVTARTADLLIAKQAAESANLAKSEFLANMSHELRTPMHAITSFAKMGVGRTGEVPLDKLRRYFENIDASAARLNGLLNDLLDLAKIEAGKMSFEFGLHDVAVLLTASLAEFEAMARDRDVTLEPRFVQAPLVAEIDEGRMKQVFANLLSNAIKFSPSGGSVLVGLSLETDQRAVQSAIVSVIDQGPGIPPDELESIFDKFVQSSKTKTGAGGTGLGLSITRKILLAHGARVKATNRAEGGAEFRLVLPLRRATSAATA